jgi:hypothetical protein
MDKKAFGGGPSSSSSSSSSLELECEAVEGSIKPTANFKRQHKDQRIDFLDASHRNRVHNRRLFLLRTIPDLTQRYKANPLPTPSHPVFTNNMFHNSGLCRWATRRHLSATNHDFYGSRGVLRAAGLLQGSSTGSRHDRGLLEFGTLFSLKSPCCGLNCIDAVRQFLDSFQPPSPW